MIMHLLFVFDELLLVIVVGKKWMMMMMNQIIFEFDGRLNVSSWEP